MTYFSNHSVRLVVWRIMRSKLGEFFSLSSLVQTLPTSSDGLTALPGGGGGGGVSVKPWNHTEDGAVGHFSYSSTHL